MQNLEAYIGLDDGWSNNESTIDTQFMHKVFLYMKGYSGRKRQFREARCRSLHPGNHLNRSACKMFWSRVSKMGTEIFETEM